MTRHRARALIALAATATTLLLPTAAEAGKPARCGNGDLAPTAENLPQVRRATLCLLNNERVERNRKRLRSNGALQTSAVEYARDMVRRDFFSHTAPGGGSLLARIADTSYLKGASRYAVGENLAWGTGELATPRNRVRAWMKSPSHKRNILDRRFREIGIGIALGAPTAISAGQDAATYTTHFGRRR